MDPAIFFPPPKRDSGQHEARALAICQGCEVRRECLNYALEHRIVEGIWGGTTEPQRRRMRVNERRMRDVS